MTSDDENQTKSHRQIKRSGVHITSHYLVAVGIICSWDTDKKMAIFRSLTRSSPTALSNDSTHFKVGHFFSIINEHFCNIASKSHRYERMICDEYLLANRTSAGRQPTVLFLFILLLPEIYIYVKICLASIITIFFLLVVFFDDAHFSFGIFGEPVARIRLLWMKMG